MMITIMVINQNNHHNDSHYDDDLSVLFFELLFLLLLVRRRESFLRMIPTCVNKIKMIKMIRISTTVKIIRIMKYFGKGIAEAIWFTQDYSRLH